MTKGKDTDCLFVHVPKFSSEYLPLGEFINITYMPMGLLALAELAKRKGFTTEILHLGVEWIHDSGYRLGDELKRRRVASVGMPIHWHYQSYDTIQVAKAVKKASPDTFVFLGGYTASYFAKEILREFECVDAVVLGDGEGAVPTLLRELSKDTPDCAKVPSLLFRQGGEIHRSNARYIAKNEDLDDLNFTDFSLLRHAPTYVRSFGFPLAFSKEYDLKQHRMHQTMGRTFFPLAVGRGCPTKCTYCGGNIKALSRINGGHRLLWRNHDRVLDDIRRALGAGYKTVSLCFDPTPDKDDYFVALFDRIRKERLAVDLYFENWGLPTKRFLESFARAFPGENSYMAYSPDSGCEAVRKFNKGFFYTNKQMLDSIRTAEEFEVQLDIFFSIALPAETIKEARITRDMIAEIREGYTNIRRLMTWSVQLEPGSPQFENPERFNMITDRRCFMDFFKAHGGEKSDTYSGLGYKINDYFGDERDRGGIVEFEAHMQHLKCMEFCFLSADPRQRVTPQQGREHCLERRKKIAARRGVSVEQKIISDGHRYDDAAKAMRAGLPKKKRTEFA